MIRALDDDTIRRIAAGEVVERPSSVVKELVENSLDAAADRIEVAVDGDGTDRIRVADDGIGMAAAELPRAVRKHATSKLAGPDDLAGITTLGFRGEALHAIGSVAAVTITSRPRDGADDAATRLRVDRGEAGSPEPAGRAPGTTVEVAGLFADTPARRKFLASPATEFDHVNRVVGGYALANPDVAVTLRHDGREVFATPGDGSLESAVLGVYGREVAAAMIDLEGDGVAGAVSHPEVNRSTRDYVTPVVNGRLVAAPGIRAAVLDAYGRQLAGDRYPFAIVSVDVPPGRVDVNVHPRKHEVRFDGPEAVADRVRTAVRDALLGRGLVRSRAPRGRSAADETPVDPGDPEHDGRARANGAGTREPPDGGVGPARTGRIRAAGSQSTLDDGITTDRREFDSLPGMRVLGQLHDTYIVAETDGGLLLIDQHAADERVRFERLRDRFDGEPQALVEPIDVELTAREAAALPAIEPALRDLGFRADRPDDRRLRVTAVPAVIDTVLEPARIRDALLWVVDRRDGDAVVGADAVLADLACAPAVTANTSLTEGRVRDLLEALDACEDPSACPHGRPVVVELDAAELDGRFERDYPGHAHRRDP